jgi:signal transduction histidine kinase
MRPSTEADLLRSLQISEYRYKNLFNTVPACFWELDFREAEAVIARWQDEGVTDLAAYLQDPVNALELMRATRATDCNQRAVAVFGNGSQDELLTSVDFFWPLECYGDYVRTVMALLAHDPSFSCETMILDARRERREVIFTACYPSDLAKEGKILIGIVDQSDTRKALRELSLAKLRADTLAEAQAFAFWQLDCTRTNRMLGELRARGITDLRAYMDEHPEFVEQALDATIVTDINQKAIDLYGHRDKEEAIGGSIRQYWVPGDYEAYKGSIEAGFNGKSQFQLVTRGKTMDGRVLDCRFWMASPPEMRASGMVMVAIQDLSEEIASQREIERLREGLAHAGRVLMIGEFAASIAHEINQPLAALRAASSAANRWLATDPPDLVQVSASLANIARSAHRAGEIIDRIRGMAAKRPPSREPVVICDLVREAVEFVSREFQAATTVPIVRIPSGLPKVFADRTEVQQVLVNLMVNALQAMEHAHSSDRKVTITASEGADGMILFSVRDSGPGIQRDDGNRLFDHFFSTKAGGMGIGLTICQSIIRAHDGRIEARNADGGGAEFIFSLPVAAGSATEPQPVEDPLFDDGVFSIG